MKKADIFKKIGKTLVTYSFLGGVLFVSACGQTNKSSNTLEPVIITLSESDFDFYIGEAKQIKASVSVPGVYVGWTSTNEDVATVKNGLVTGVGEGYTEIIANVSNIAYASIYVGVTEYIKPISYDPIITVLDGFEELTVFNVQDTEDVDLTKGLKAEDYLGNELEIEVVSDGGFNPKELGQYTISYKTVDEDNKTEAAFTRIANVTYFGLTKEDLLGIETSKLDSWSYTPDSNQNITADEWIKHVVPGHSSNWNKFEGPYDEETSTYMNCLIMHGSDTNGHGFDSDVEEDEDEYPNTILYNKFTVEENKAFLHLQCSVNPYPDFNNMVTKFRFTVMDPVTLEARSEDYRTQLAPISSSGTELDYSKVRNGIFEDIDLSEYIGKTIILLIEQDSPTDVYQEQFYLDIGYEEFQLTGIINETRDTFVVYGMSLIDAPLQGTICAFNDNEWRKLALDKSLTWGNLNSIFDESDSATFGLRSDLDALKKWSYYNKDGKVDISNRSNYHARQFLSWASSPNEINDLKPEQCLVNKIIAQKNKFVVYAGTDSDLNMINFRFNVVTSKGAIISLSPASYSENKYTPLTDDWGCIHCGEWVYGCKLEFDISSYKDQEITIVMETDQAAEGNPTIWFNAMGMVD